MKWVVMAGQIDWEWFQGERDRLEERFRLLLPEKPQAEQLAEFSRAAFTEEAALVTEAMERAKMDFKESKPRGTWYFNYYWNKQNRNL